MNLQKAPLLTCLLFCTTMIAPVHASAEQTFGLTGPSLVLSDDLGRPFYPADTHIFTGPVAATRALDFGVPAQARAAKTQFVVSEIQPRANHRAASPRHEIASPHLLFEPPHTAPARRAEPGLSSMPIMDSWSVGVFR